MCDFMCRTQFACKDTKNFWYRQENRDFSINKIYDSIKMGLLRHIWLISSMLPRHSNKKFKNLHFLSKNDILQKVARKALFLRQEKSSFFNDFRLFFDTFCYLADNGEFMVFVVFYDFSRLTRGCLRGHLHMSKNCCTFATLFKKSAWAKSILNIWLSR